MSCVRPGASSDGSWMPVGVGGARATARLPRRPAEGDPFRRSADVIGPICQRLVGRLPWDLVSWRGDPRAPRCPMSRHRKDPLRPLTVDERPELTRLSRSPRAPAAQVERARALLAIADGASYTAAAHQVGRRPTETLSAWVSRFNRNGLAAVRPGHGGGPRIRYGADAQQRILAEWARTPQREPDGTATWSLSLLQRSLRKAPDGLPRVSTYTIWRTLHEAGLAEEPHLGETGVV